MSAVNQEVGVRMMDGTSYGTLDFLKRAMHSEDYTRVEPYIIRGLISVLTEGNQQFFSLREVEKTARNLKIKSGEVVSP